VCRAIQPVERFRLGAVRTADGQVRTAISPNGSKQGLLVSPWPSATERRFQETTIFRRVSNSVGVVRPNNSQ